MKLNETQGLVDKRYELLRLSALVLLAFDVFFFFACYVCANTLGETVWSFQGLVKTGTNSLLPVLLRYILLCLAIISLPMVMHGRKLALIIQTPKDRSLRGVGLETINSAFLHYRRTYRMVFGILSIVNILAAVYFIAFGVFWLLVAVSCIGFLAKLAIFPRRRAFNRWMWRVIEAIRGPAIA